VSAKAFVGADSWTHTSRAKRGLQEKRQGQQRPAFFDETTVSNIMEVSRRSSNFLQDEKLRQYHYDRKYDAPLMSTMDPVK
jgi:hypothetical protein